MDDTSFDNIARRLGGLRSRRAALKTAGGAAAVVFTALGLETSALAQVSIENHCKVPGLSCNKKKQCCGAKKKSKEIVCDLSNAGTGRRCCGRNRASCRDDNDCCLNYFCNIANECSLI